MTASADILFYVQHLLGVGHLRRAALIAKALDRAGLSVTFVSGGMPVPGLDIGGAAFAQLPPLRTADQHFSALVDEVGRPVDDAWRGARRDRMLALFRRVRPRLLLTEMFPFGRRQLRFELIPLLEAARASQPRPLVVSSVRDVINRPGKPEKSAWIVETLRRYFDRVLVHGDPSFLTLETSFPEAAQVADMLDYTGYVVNTPPQSRSAIGEGAGEVLVSTGGGAVAGPLIDAALAARPLTRLQSRVWRILAGHNLPEATFRAYRKRVEDGVVLERARPDFLDLLSGAELSISQAGYNTVLEILAAGPPAVVVPFAGGAETEQSLRAALLAERGLLTVVEEARPGDRRGREDGRHTRPLACYSAAMTTWREIERELDAWAEAGRSATFWWRDDDAVEPTAALDRLLALAVAQEIPVATAVVPGRSNAALGRHLAAAADVATPLQHGYLHRSHAPAGEKKAELGPHRPSARICEELMRGAAQMAALFGPEALPVLVPPWNRIAPELTRALPKLGLTGLSTYGARQVSAPVPGLTQANTHVDIMRWDAPRGFLGEPEALDLLCGHLQARRLAAADGTGVDPTEPTGLLTHHLAHDEDAWEFLERVLPLLARHPATRAVTASEVFCAAPNGASEGLT
jgi:predicted glycosyltransferase